MFYRMPEKGINRKGGTCTSLTKTGIDHKIRVNMRRSDKEGKKVLLFYENVATLDGRTLQGEYGGKA